MLLNAEINSWSGNVKNLDEEGVARIKLLFPNASKNGDYLHNASGIVNAEDLSNLLGELDLRAEIKPYDGNLIVTNKTNGWQRRMEALEADGKVLREHFVANRGMAVAQIHVPNFFMCTVNMVKVEEDYCTDKLQLDLDNGWRILCICPPTIDRRPTYIMGKHEPTKI
jgi:hypothetical protein